LRLSIYSDIPDARKLQAACNNPARYSAQAVALGARLESFRAEVALVDVGLPRG
jgi:hypothetical protein